MYVCMYVTGLCVLEWFRSHAFFLKDQKECQNQNDTLIPCLICSLYGIVLPVLFAVWHLIKNGRGLLLCHMLSWSSAWTEDQTQGAGKYSGRFTDFIIVVLPGWSCVRSLNLIPGTNKRNNNQFERPRRTYKLLLFIITKSMRALWLVNQLWFTVPVYSLENRASSKLLYKSNRPQVSMVQRHDRPLEIFEEH